MCLLIEPAPEDEAYSRPSVRRYPGGPLIALENNGDEFVHDLPVCQECRLDRCVRNMECLVLPRSLTTCVGKPPLT